MLLTRANSASEAAIVAAVHGMPQRKALLNSLGQDFQFFTRTCGGLGREEVRGLRGDEVFVVTALQDRIEHVPHHSFLSCAQKRPHEKNTDHFETTQGATRKGGQKKRWRTGSGHLLNCGDTAAAIKPHDRGGASNIKHVIIAEKVILSRG